MATPPDAVAVSVPPSVPPPGLLPSATVTVPLNEESRLPELFSASTVRPKGVPAVTSGRRLLGHHQVRCW